MGEREWITINGERIQSVVFIGQLDWFRADRQLIDAGEEIRHEYCKMIVPLQEITDKYLQGADHIGKKEILCIERHDLKTPSDIRLPEGIEELFLQIEKSLCVDFSEMLKKCRIESENRHMKVLEARRKEEARQKQVLAMSVAHEDLRSDDAVVSIGYLIQLHKAKVACDDYHLNEKEITATSIWCDLLVQSMIEETITYGQLLRLIENDFVEYDSVSDLLEIVCQQDMGCREYLEKLEWERQPLDYRTVICTKDVLDLCGSKFKQILGIALIH